MTRQVSRRAAAEDFDALVGALQGSREPIEVEDEGRVIAVVLSPDAFEAWERRAFFSMLDELRAANKDADPDGVLADVTRAVEDVRSER